MINKPKGYDELEENEVVSDSGLEVGIYPVQIKKVTDISDKEYLQIEFEIVKGKYVGYFGKLKESLELESWPNQGIYRASYKETATKFFKAFITAVQKSNQGYVWNWNEQSLVGKYFIAVFGQEEYEDANGDVKVSTKIREPRSIEAWKKGEIKVPEYKKLKRKETPVVDPFANIVNISEEDLPF